MKVNYDKIKGCAILPINEYNLHELVLKFVYDGVLPITSDYLHGRDMELYKKWHFFIDRVRSSFKQYKDRFAIALSTNSLEGCVYGDVSDLAKEGYEIISITSALEELPNICNILELL